MFLLGDIFLLRKIEIVFIIFDSNIKVFFDFLVIIIVLLLIKIVIEKLLEKVK